LTTLVSFVLVTFYQREAEQHYGSGERADSLNVQYRDEVVRTSFMPHIFSFVDSASIKETLPFSGEGRTDGGSGSV
jgi:hypothetical protein